MVLNKMKTFTNENFNAFKEKLIKYSKFGKKIVLVLGLSGIANYLIAYPQKAGIAFQAKMDRLSEVGNELGISPFNSEWAYSILKKEAEDQVPYAVNLMNELDDHYLCISTKEKIGLSLLLKEIEDRLFDRSITMKCVLPYTQMKMMTALRENADVKELDHLESGVLIEVTGSKEIIGMLERAVSKIDL